jgi:hypothetical protein
MCRHNCHKDRDTGDTFCPVMHRWVESCPLQDGDRKEDRDDD